MILLVIFISDWIVFVTWYNVLLVYSADSDTCLPNYVMVHTPDADHPGRFHSHDPRHNTDSMTSLFICVCMLTYISASVAALSRVIFK